MDEPKKPVEKVPHRKSNFFKSPIHLLVVALVVVGLIAACVHLTKNRHNEPATLKNTGSGGPSLSISSDNMEPMQNSEVKISVWEDSGNVPVNAVQANMSYPTDKFDYVKSDSGTSSFEVQAQATGEDGKITLARGHVGSLTGRQLVAVVTLKTKSSPGSASLNFLEGSALVDSNENKNILTQSNGAIFNIKSN